MTNLLYDDLKSATNKGRPIPPKIQILVTLQYLGSASLQSTVGDAHNLSQPSVSLCVTRVCNALIDKKDAFISWPTSIRTIQTKFFETAGFPKVVGVIDGTHIRIKQPHDTPNAFINRKYYPSINVCAVSDPNHKFTFVSVRWPGSCHDSFVLKQTNLWDEFEGGLREGVILGDSGYPCRSWLMTPVSVPRERNEEAYNIAHKRTRVIIECAFGMLKKRFRILHDEMRVPTDKIPILILATVILHNIAVDMQMTSFSELEFNEDPSDDNETFDEATTTQNGTAMRKFFIDSFFS